MECGRGCWRVKRRWDWLEEIWNRFRILQRVIQEMSWKGILGKKVLKISTFFLLKYADDVRRPYWRHEPSYVWYLVSRTHPRELTFILTKMLSFDWLIAWINGLNTLRTGHKLRAFSCAIKRNKHLSQNCVFETFSMSYAHILEDGLWTLLTCTLKTIYFGERNTRRGSISREV